MCLYMVLHSDYVREGTKMTKLGKFFRIQSLSVFLYSHCSPFRCIFLYLGQIVARTGMHALLGPLDRVNYLSQSSSRSNLGLLLARHQFPMVLSPSHLLPLRSHRFCHLHRPATRSPCSPIWPSLIKLYQAVPFANFDGYKEEIDLTHSAVEKGNSR